MIELILSLFLLFVGVVFKEDIKALLPILTRSIIRSAARKLPQNLQGRYYEEWLAHSDELPTWVQRLTHAASLYCIGASAIVHSAKDKFARTRRVLDISLAIILLAWCAPVLTILFVLNKVDGGPACWLKPLSRHDGSSAQLYKFRTLAIRNDGKNLPNKLGPFLRKSSLDELPLLLNVIKGDISLIGVSIYRRSVETTTSAPFGIIEAPSIEAKTHFQFVMWYFASLIDVYRQFFTPRA